MPRTPAEKKLLAEMQGGKRLMWFGDNGPELEGHPFWPQKRIVRKLLRDGVLRWGEPLNKTQDEFGICPIVLTEANR